MLWALKIFDAWGFKARRNLDFCGLFKRVQKEVKALALHVVWHEACHCSRSLMKLHPQTSWIMTLSHKKGQWCEAKRLDLWELPLWKQSWSQNFLSTLRSSLRCLRPKGFENAEAVWVLSPGSCLVLPKNAEQSHFQVFGKFSGRKASGFTGSTNSSAAKAVAHASHASHGFRVSQIHRPGKDFAMPGVWQRAVQTAGSKSKAYTSRLFIKYPNQMTQIGADVQLLRSPDKRDGAGLWMASLV